MTEFLFSKIEIDLIKYLRKNTPVKIWWEPLAYIFEFESFYIELSIKCSEKLNLRTELNNEGRKDLTHSEQYVMSAKVEKVENRFIAQEASEILASNEKIEEIKIVRTLNCKRPFTEYRDKPHLLSSNSFIMNPKLCTDHNSQPDHKYLVDVGIFIELSKKQLKCFIHDNDDDFQINSISQDNLKENMEELHQFISID